MSNLTEEQVGENRFVLFPIKYQEIWNQYKLCEANFWTSEEIDLSQDIEDWKKLTNNEKHFISNVLAFFAASDGIVAENLAVNFYKDIKIPEARSYYAFQMQMENIHSETYSLLIDTYISDKNEKNRLFNAITTVPIVKKKADWALKYLENNDISFEEKLIAFAVVEGLFFSSSFCSIFWLKKRGLMQGLSFSNTLISRDENSHTEFACLLYKMSDAKIDKNKINQIIKEAVEIECEFASESLPVELIGMNSKLMCQYIEYVADRLLISLDCKKIYNSTNPFDFMSLISLVEKGNFFEKRISSYQKSGVGRTVEENTISFNEDF